MAYTQKQIDLLLEISRTGAIRSTNSSGRTLHLLEKRGLVRKSTIPFVWLVTAAGKAAAQRARKRNRLAKKATFFSFNK